MAVAFLYVLLPLIRFLVDYPFWYYAYYFKTFNTSLSPDNKKIMDNVEIIRNLTYGLEEFDLLLPKTNKEAPVAFGEKIPIVWFHGGGHLFCQREVLNHRCAFKGKQEEAD